MFATKRDDIEPFDESDSDSEDDLSEDLAPSCPISVGAINDSVDLVDVDRFDRELDGEPGDKMRRLLSVR